MYFYIYIILKIKIDLNSVNNVRRKEPEEESMFLLNLLKIDLAAIYDHPHYDICRDSNAL